jgi:protoporphyrinogen/coproporphyrinogen III oxidase
MTEANKIAVIGGGISGLACAYRLQQLGVPVTLFEAEDHVGGLIDTVEKDRFLFESGPQSFQGTETLLALIEELGIRGELCEANPRASRFVLRHGKLQKVPMTPQALVTSSLLGAGSRWKLVSEPLRRSRPPDEDESVANFVRRKFGNEILEYLVSPFVSGIYAGDPEKLSLRAAFPSLEAWERTYGSVVRGAMKSRSVEGGRKSPSMCSFERGVGSLPRALADRLGTNLETHTKVCAIRHKAPPDGYQIYTERSGRAEAFFAKGVVIATPAYAASHLVNSISARLAQVLSGIPYAGMAVVAGGYYTQQIARSLSGFGFLVPRGEKLTTLGTVWNSSLFPGRAREGSVTITSFAGGATEAEVLNKPAEEIAAIVQADNAKVLAITGSPVASAVWKHPKALPQYNLGHGDIVAAVSRTERQNPGIFFSGNYLEGPSIGKCVEHGFKTAEAARDFLGSEE